MCSVGVCLAGPIRGATLPPSAVVQTSGNAMLEATKTEPPRDALVMNSMLSLRACRHGPMMYLRNDMYIARSFDQYGDYSEAKVHLRRRFLHPAAASPHLAATIPLL